MKDRGRTFLNEIRDMSDKQYKKITDDYQKEQEHNRLMRIEGAKKVIPNIIESIKLAASKGEYHYDFKCDHDVIEIEYIIKVLKEEYCIPNVYYKEKPYFNSGDDDTIFINWDKENIQPKENKIKQWFDDICFSIYCYFH